MVNKTTENVYSWRTVVIENKSKLYSENGTLVIEKDDMTKHVIPLYQIRTLLLSTGAVTLTAALMNELSDYNINLVICDNKHMPTASLVPFGNHYETSGRISEQIEWSKERKSLVWQTIVRLKISSQIQTLALCGHDIPQKMTEYLNNVTPDDATNREAQAARLYFRCMFGYSFTRFAHDDLNYALNYGYSLILSSFSRILSAHGFHTAIGIKHCNEKNLFNLACDLMEPFRSYIDRIASQFIDKPFDWNGKKKIIEALQGSVIYRGCSYSLLDGAEKYTLDVVNALKDEKTEIGSILFE